jgi:hypothetical protein
MAMVLDDDDDLLDDVALTPDPDPPPAAYGSPEHLFGSLLLPSTRPPEATTSSTAPTPGDLDGTLTAPGLDDLLLTDGHSAPFPRAGSPLPGHGSVFP